MPVSAPTDPQAELIALAGECTHDPLRWVKAAYEVLRSYAKVAAAVGAKKSTVRDWIKGNRRGQVGPRTSERDPLVNAHYRMPLSRRRNVLERGGAKWINALVERALSAEVCANRGGNMGTGCNCAHSGARVPGETGSD